MNLLENYESDASQDNGQQEEKKKIELLGMENRMVLAPECDIQMMIEEKEREKKRYLETIYKKEKWSNHLTGRIEHEHMSHFIFDEQFNNFKNVGIAIDPCGQKIVNNKELVDKQDIQGVDQYIWLKQKGSLMNRSKEEKERKQKIKGKRISNWDSGSSEFRGPWGGYKDVEKLMEVDDEVIKQHKEVLSKLEEKRNRKMEEQIENQAKKEEVQSIFHGKEMVDYQGKSYILPPNNVKLMEHTCYIPKKQIAQLKGHSKGVNKIEFYPKYGHFLLSGSMDCRIKLWDMQQTKKCVRTYMGHQQAVRDVNFTNDGFNFLSAGYDQNIHYWDTEYGKIIQTFHLKNYPYCVKLNPDYNLQNTFLVGSSNKKIGQYDLKSGQRTAVYDEHLGAVNSLTFIDGNRKFVSTSDDKKIFVWEFGLPVVVKHISEPELHAISKATVHPNMKYFLGQSADNKIVIYDSKAGNFRQNRKKFFTGHVSAGYAIGLQFSPDGQFVCSGDADGRLWFWDWKTTKNYRTIQAHKAVTIDVAWHPIEPSRVATASWDGTIKYWD